MKARVSIVLQDLITNNGQDYIRNNEVIYGDFQTKKEAAKFFNMLADSIIEKQKKIKNIR